MRDCPVSHRSKLRHNGANANGFKVPERETIGSQRGRSVAVLTLVSPIHTRKPRGMPVAQLSIEIAADGEVRVELREEGTTNSISGKARVGVT